MATRAILCVVATLAYVAGQVEQQLGTDEASLAPRRASTSSGLESLAPGVVGAHIYQHRNHFSDARSKKINARIRELLLFSDNAKSASSSHPLLNEPQRPTVPTIAETTYNRLTYYLMNITIGTPPQEFLVQVDTGSSDLWIPSRIIQYNGFDPSQSRSFRHLQEKFSIRYVKDHATGYWATDTVGLGGSGISLPHLQFAVANNAPDATMGILGIGPYQSETSQRFYRNLPIRLVQDGHISRNVYSMYMGNLEDEQGTILFGGTDTAKYECLVTLPFTSNTTLEVQLDGITLGRSLDTNDPDCPSWSPAPIDQNKPSPHQPPPPEMPPFSAGPSIIPGPVYTTSPESYPASSTQLHPPLETQKSDPSTASGWIKALFGKRDEDPLCASSDVEDCKTVLDEDAPKGNDYSDDDDMHSKGIVDSRDSLGEARAGENQISNNDGWQVYTPEPDANTEVQEALPGTWYQRKSENKSSRSNTRENENRHESSTESEWYLAKDNLESHESFLKAASRQISRSSEGQATSEHEHHLTEASQLMAGGPTNVLLDTGTSLTYLPSDIVRTIADQFSATYEDELGMYVVSKEDLDSVPLDGISLSFAGLPVHMPKGEMFWPLSWFTMQESPYYVMTLLPSSQSMDYNILGDSFLRNAYVIYDLDRREVHLGQYKPSDQTNVVAV